MRYFPKTLTKAESEAAIARYRDKTRRHGYCFTPAVLKSTGEVIGMIGLGYTERGTDFAPFTEIGWRLDKRFWGQGYAPEGARAWLRYAFERLSVRRVVAQTALQNTPSRRVMEKIGMREDCCFNHPLLADCPEIERNILYVIDREEFLSQGPK